MSAVIPLVWCLSRDSFARERALANWSRFRVWVPTLCAFRETDCLYNNLGAIRWKHTSLDTFHPPLRQTLSKSTEDRVKGKSLNRVRQTTYMLAHQES